MEPSIDPPSAFNSEEELEWEHPCRGCGVIETVLVTREFSRAFPKYVAVDCWTCSHCDHENEEEVDLYEGP